MAYYNSMKKLLTLLVIFVVFSGAASAQGQDPDYNTRQFNDQPTMLGKLGMVRSATADGTATTEFYAYALDSLLRLYPNVQGNSETKAADDMAQTLSAKLGEAGHTESGLNLWRVVENFTNPLVRAEALTALGKAKATDLLPQVIQLLTDINLEPGKDPMVREQVAYGAVIGLEEYKDGSGYLPVFFVTTGWYTDRVKKRAREALPKILDNPTDPLISVIKSSSYNYAVKYTAIQTLEAANVSPQEKSQGAVASLAEAWGTSTNDARLRAILVNTRKLSLNMIRRYGTDDDNAYPLLEKCYWQGVDEEEQIAAISALSALATEDSVQRLAGFLNDINTRLDRGTLTRKDERLIRVIIPALANTGKASARDPLRTILQKNWTGAVQRLAQDALKKVQ